MVKTTEELQSIASECRALAAATRRQEIREQLLEVAEQFERLAAREAMRARVHRPVLIG